MEAFNMDHDFGQFVVSFATVGLSMHLLKIFSFSLTIEQLARGNAFIGKLSIGGVSDKIPPLPGKIDGPVAGGIAKHGRFEGMIEL
jgi:hypothetical protein